MAAFASNLGGQDALAQAVASRATGQAGATQQVTPAAPTYDPSTQVPPASPLPPVATPGNAPVSSPAQAAAPQPGMPFESPESRLILKSLDTRLKAISDMEKAKLGMVA